MPEAQKSIFYLTGESRQQIENSPHMEAFRAKGVEVLFLHDPVDEMWVSSGVEYDGKPFRSIAKGEVDLDELDDDESTSDKTTDARDAEFEGLLGWLGETLDADVSEARLSHRLTESAACLVGDTYSMSPQLERLYRASGQELPKTKRALEVNADHPLITGLNAAFAAGDDHSRLVPTAKLIYGMALIAEGGELDDPADFARLLAGTLTESVAANGSTD